MLFRHRDSLYDAIAAAAKDGALPADFSLPRGDQLADGIQWADGAQDGVAYYHMRRTKPADEALRLMKNAVSAASEHAFHEADRLFTALGKTARAITMADTLLTYVLEHMKQLTMLNLYAWSRRALLHSSDRECVKYGLCLLVLFKTGQSGRLKQAIRVIGLSDEFTRFACLLMRHWPDGNDEIWALAKKVHGWGRIHAVELLEPRTEAIRRWFLLDAVHNDIMSAYSALPCWQKSNAADLLKGRPTREEFTGLRDLLEALTDEEPVTGLSAIRDREAVVLRFLDTARALPLEAADYVTVRHLRDWFDESGTGAPVVKACQELLSTPDCRAAVTAALQTGEAVDLAEELGIECRPALFRLMQTDFETEYYRCKKLIDDPEYHDDVITLFRERLPLSEMRAAPTTASLGTGPDFARQNALAYILHVLKPYPLEGQDLVEAGLQCGPVRTRSAALITLQAWADIKKAPLSGWWPACAALLGRLREAEPDDGVKDRMDQLLAE